MRLVVKEYSKNITPSQNESRTDNVQADINNSFWEIVMPITILDINKWNVKHTINIIINISTRM